jgi:hypothetical protein
VSATKQVLASIFRNTWRGRSFRFELDKSDDHRVLPTVEVTTVATDCQSLYSDPQTEEIGGMRLLESEVEI